jgi:hypothetical protein
MEYEFSTQRTTKEEVLKIYHYKIVARLLQLPRWVEKGAAFLPRGCRSSCLEREFEESEVYEVVKI